MKYLFHNLQHALDFRQYCPFCSERMLIEGRAKIETVFNDRTYTVSKPVRHFSTRISWRTEDGEEIWFNPSENTIEIAYRYANDMPIGSDVHCSSPRFNRTPKAIYDGHLYEKMKLVCEHCGNYEYMVQIVIDVGRKRIDEIVLNHEKLEWKEATNQIHRVRNVYTFDQTEYTTFFPGDGKYDKVKEWKQTTLPLIPLNLDELQKTIDRIKTLVLFS